MVLKLILKPLILQELSLETEAYNQRANFQFLRHHLLPSKANVSEITSYIFSLITLLKYPMYCCKFKDRPAPVLEGYFCNFYHKYLPVAKYISFLKYSCYSCVEMWMRGKKNDPSY